MATTDTDNIVQLPGTLPVGTYQGGRDMRQVLRDVTDRNPVDPELKRRFTANRRRVARTHALMGAEARRRAVFDLEVLGPEPTTAQPTVPPIPGGIGFGMFYSPQFKEDFAEGTALYWEIVCPRVAGGNVADFLYITATNRAGLGVEAFVLYQGQASPHFMIFDWSRVHQQQDPWMRNVPLNELTNYLRETNAHGAPVTVLPVLNLTFQSPSGGWMNQVSLLNAATNAWEPAYQEPYPANALEQHGQWMGSWGPLVETFEAHYQGTNPMGALNTQLAVAANGSWVNWQPLNAGESQLRADNKGFLPIFVDPNESWVVRS